jgi:hypothetical protein
MWAPGELKDLRWEIVALSLAVVGTVAMSMVASVLRVLKVL